MVTAKPDLAPGAASLYCPTFLFKYSNVLTQKLEHETDESIETLMSVDDSY